MSTTIRFKILAYLRTQDHPQSAKKIAQIIKEKENSVRPELSKLVREGVIQRVRHGYYSTNPMYVEDLVHEPPRVQNLLVVAEGVDVEAHDAVDLPFGGDVRSDTFLRVSIEFGVKRDKISWRVKAPLGLDLYALRLCRGLVEEVCAVRGYSGLTWIVRNFELLYDYQGFELKGANAITFSDLDGTLEKIYNRRDGVRREVRSSKETSLEALIALTQGGLALFQVVQGVFYVGKNVAALTDAVMYTNRSQLDISRQQLAILEALYRVIDRIGGDDPAA